MKKPPATRRQYWKKGALIWMVKGTAAVEVNLEDVEWGVVSILYTDTRSTMMKVPNPGSYRSNKAEFQTAFKKALSIIKKNS